MAENFPTRVWTALARELLERRDLRDHVRTSLETALAEGDPERRAGAIRRGLAEAAVRDAQRQAQTEGRRQEDAERQRRQLARARQSRALVEHALGRLSAGEELVSGRLCGFLRDQVASYAAALSRAGAEPGEGEAPQDLAERVLTAVSEHQVAARPLRVGILTPAEVSALESGQLDPSDAPTVRSTGDLARDLEAWEQRAEVSDQRKEALREGRIEDGQYLVTIIEPTPSGHRVAVHAITASGDTVAEPVREVTIAAREEAVPAVEMFVEQTVRRSQPSAPEPLPHWGGAAPEEQPTTLEPTGLRDAAVALNQARLNLYAQILDRRGELGDEARREAERQLRRMQAESEEAAGEMEPTRLLGFLEKWRQELTRDMTELLQRADGGAGSLDALARLGALRYRLDAVQASARGVEKRERTMRGAGGEELVFARPQVEPTSIFQGLAQVPLAPAARQAAAHPVAGETLTGDVVARNAARSTRPSRESRQILTAIKEGGRQLQRALTTAHSLQETGLGLSQELRPLLRAAMPSDIRPDLRSPLMRQVLLPALERVSGRQRTMARTTAQRQAARAPTFTPEALYGMMLGRSGDELMRRSPEVARDVMAQLAGLSDLGQAAPGGTAVSLMQAGERIVSRVMGMAQRSPEAELAESEEGSGGDALGRLSAQSLSLAAGPAGVDRHLVDDVSSSLQAEGAGLSTSLKEQVAPFLPGDVPYGQRVFQGAFTDLVLDKMGAAGATVGEDIYMRSDLAGQDEAAVAAHELAHVTQRKGASVESLEREAYAVESNVRDFLAGVELAAEDSGDIDLPLPPESPEEMADLEYAVEELADIIERWRREAREAAIISTCGYF